MADLSEIFNEISPEAPCGADLEYDNERIALDTGIQGTPEDQFSGQKYEPPNWREVQKQALALLKRSKDLQVILYLIRSLIQLEGVTGFRDGLNYLEKSVNGYWDSIYPHLDPDDGDATQRLNIIEELCNRELVLNPLSLCILVESKSVGRFSLRDIYYATEKLPMPAEGTKPDINLINAAFNEADTETLRATYQAILESANLLEQIDSGVGQRVGGMGNGVNLDAIKSLIKDIRFNFEQFASDKLSDVNYSDQEAGVGDEAGAGTSNKPVKPSAHAVGEIASRQDVIKTLDLLCKYYSQHEPSSPVPLLLHRAKVLADSSFMEIVKNLLPDALSQIEIIKGPEPGSD